MKAWLCVLLALLAAPAAAQSPFDKFHLGGGLFMAEVASGRDVLSYPTATPVLPLSTVKLLLAAAAWDREIRTGIDLDALIVHGSDEDGRRLALALRRALGSEKMLAMFAAFGFPTCRAKQEDDCLALSPATPDAEWAEALSIGESDATVTLPQLVRFLRAIGGGGILDGKRVMSDTAARHLQRAMLDNVAHGTAKGSDAALPKDWRMGGKTGSGPASALPLTDGIFAGLVFDRQGHARYAFTTYVYKGGKGGGAAARISAEAAREVVEGR
jgi:hypothetical protein